MTHATVFMTEHYLDNIDVISSRGLPCRKGKPAPYMQIANYIMWARSRNPVIKEIMDFAIVWKILTQIY